MIMPKNLVAGVYEFNIAGSECEPAIVLGGFPWVLGVEVAGDVLRVKVDFTQTAYTPDYLQQQILQALANRRRA